MYGMDKTTVYLPAELKAALRRAARRRNTSEADLIRQGIAMVTAEETPRSPRLPLFESGQRDLAARTDELLSGFGEH
jgi:hypothetical protein